MARYLPDSAPLRDVLHLVSPSAAIVGLAGFAGSAAHGHLANVGAEYDVSAGPSRRAAAEATGQPLPLPPPPPRRGSKEDDYEVRWRATQARP